MSRLFIMGLWLYAGSVVAQTKSQTLFFSVVPQQKASVLSKKWKPLLKIVSEKSGIRIRFITAANIDIFAQALKEGKYDMVYANPLQFVEANAAASYEAFAKAKGKKIRGIMVKRKGDSIPSLQDLAGKSVAFPSGAFAATLLPMAEMASLGIDYDAVFTKNHSSGYAGVAKSLFTAAGGVKRTLAAESNKVSKELEVFWTSKGYTPHALAIHPRHSKKVFESIQKAFLSLNQDQAAMAILRDELKIKHGLEKAQSSDWSDVAEVRRILQDRKLNTK